MWQLYALSGAPQCKCVWFLTADTCHAGSTWFCSNRRLLCSALREWVLMCLLCWDQHKTCCKPESKQNYWLPQTRVSFTALRSDSELLHISAYVMMKHMSPSHNGPILTTPGPSLWAVCVCVCVCVCERECVWVWMWMCVSACLFTYSDIQQNSVVVPDLHTECICAEKHVRLQLSFFKSSAAFHERDAAVKHVCQEHVYIESNRTATVCLIFDDADRLKAAAVILTVRKSLNQLDL